MPGSLKLKFTFVFTSIMAFTLILFSSVLYGVMNQNKPDISRQRINSVLEQNPELNALIWLSGKDRREVLLEIGELIEAQQRAQYNRMILFLLVPTILVGGGFAYMTACYLVDPIQKLRKDVEKLDGQDVTQRIPKRRSSTEIEYLQKSFNELLDKVESAFESQEEFIQDAAHELRTPLAAIKAHLDLLKGSNHKSKKELIQATNILAEMNESLIELSEDLLYLDRRSSSQYQKTAMHELVDDVLEMLNPRIIEKKIKVVKRYNYKGLISIDPKAISRAIENVIENSIKYSSEDPLVTIEIKKMNDQIVISIKDNGIGIRKSDQSKVFDRFYRGDDAQSVDGSGLGLAIVKKVIDDHNGEVELSSKKGRGTTILIKLPISE